MESTEKPFFPLVNVQGNAISVRQSFDSSHGFQKLIYTANSDASSLDGDDMEVVALTCVTLASLQYSEQVLSGVPLPRSIATIYHLLMPDTLSSQTIAATELKVTNLLSGAARTFADVEVPACPCAASSFDSAWLSSSNTPTPKVGQLTRPANLEMRDGAVHDKAGGKILHLECKNLMKGFTKGMLTAVVKRLRADYHVSCIFTSHHKSIWETGGEWKKFVKEDLGLDENCACFLVISTDDKPSWLSIERGTLELAPGENTTHLVVIFATGTVAPK
eukprot:scaffold37676_cov52-Attheya_sp.AAC.2